MIDRVQTILAIIASLQILGCATVTNIPDDMGRTGGDTSMDARGPEVSAVSADKAQTMIVLTVTQSVHQGLTGGKRIRPRPTKGVQTDAELLPQAYTHFLDELSDRYGLTPIADWPLQSIGARCLVFQAVGSLPRDEIILSLSQDPRIEAAQPLNLFKTLADRYNDPYLDLQHGLRSMQIERSHQWATGKNISIAVVDTGVDVSHPDLRDRVALARNFVDQDSIAFQSDLHGTAVAAVIGATANNGTGIVGVAPGARLLALKGCWQPAHDVDNAFCSSFTLAKSINFAVQQNVDVINLSLAGPRDPLLEALVIKAVEHGIIVVGAMGSQSNQFPSALEQVIAVTQSDSEKRHKGTYLKAPGKKIISASPQGGYDFYSGSSISAALVSGVAALVRERKTHMSATDMRGLLLQTSQTTRSVSVPAGSVDACRALAHLVGSDQC